MPHMTLKIDLISFSSELSVQLATYYEYCHEFLQATEHC